MDIQQKIRLQAAQQQDVYKEMQDFMKDSKQADSKAAEAASKFDPSTVVLPGVRGTQDTLPDIKFRQNLGKEAFVAKDFKKAEQIYQGILDTFAEIPPETKAQLYFNLGLCAQQLNPKSQDLQHGLFSLAISCDPAHSKARLRRALISYDKQNYQEALDDFKASGKDSDKYAVQIQTCIAKTTVSVPKTAITFSESSDDDNTKNMKQPKAQQQQPAPKPQPQPKRVDYEPNYELPGETEEKKANYFILKLREFVKFQDNLAEFVGQFHSAVLQQHFERFNREITISELERIVVCVGQSDFTVAKKLNIVFGLSSIKMFQSHYLGFDGQTKQVLRDFYALAEKEQLTEVQQKRLAALKGVWE